MEMKNKDKGYKCPYCNKKCKTKAGLKSHINWKHNEGFRKLHRIKKKLISEFFKKLKIDTTIKTNFLFKKF